jgi:hypothetical protein
MANPDHLQTLWQGVATWNAWREREPLIITPDLGGADLSGADLSGGNLGRADLSRANLGAADLSRANLREANLGGKRSRSAKPIVHISIGSPRRFAVACGTQGSDAGARYCRS